MAIGATKFNFSDGEGQREITPLSIASVFASATSYAVGDYCSYDGTLYRCTTAHTGVWDASDFTVVTVGGELSSMSGGGDGLTDAIKTALLTIAQKVAYVDDQGATYYQALHDALYPPADLVSIGAVYTQSGTVYDTDSLDDLKDDLVVTATYDDSSTAVVTTYTLSGTLTVGTSTITVSYGGKTTTFTVTVTHATTGYVTDGLFAYWDAIDNQGTGSHVSNAVTWVDLVNQHTWNPYASNDSKSWSWENGNSLVFNPPNTGNRAVPVNTWLCTRPGTDLRTLEVVFTPADLACCVGEFTSDTTSLTDGGEQIVGVLSSDDTFITQGAQNGYNATDITAIKCISATYNASRVAQKAFMNGEEVTTQGSSHSFKYHKDASMVLGAQNSSSGFYYPFKGTVHAIRMYSKELTAEEIAQNYAVDVQRFGLGA